MGAESMTTPFALDQTLFALTRRPNVRSRGLAAICLIFLYACSGGDDDANRGPTDFTSVEERIRQGAQPWVAAISEAYEAQVSSAAELSPVDAARSIDSETTALADLICQAIEPLDEGDERGEQGSTLSTTMDELAMAGVAARPNVLQELGMTTWGTWPPFMLKEPPPEHDVVVGPFPGALEEHIKAEFLNGDKGLIFPNPGTESYGAFQDWYQFDPEKDNRLFEIGSRTAEPLRKRVSDCSPGSS